MSAVRTIAFLGSSGIGDFLVSTPVLKKLRKLYPQAKICYVVSSPTPFQELFEKSPFIDELFQVDKRNKFFLVKSILKLREKEYDIAVCPFPRKLASKIFVRLIRTKRLIESSNDYRTPKNIILKSIETMEAEGFKFSFKERELTWPYPLEPYRNKVNSFLVENGIRSQDRLVIIHPGSRQLLPGETWSPNYWPASRWVAVINYLIKIHRTKVVVMGMGKDAEQVNAIISGVKNNSKLVNSFGKFIVRETAALIDKCDLFISTNSGPMWMAASLHKPQVAICGPSLRQWEPYSPRAIVVRHLLNRPHCDPPCSEKRCYYRDSLCMAGIRADMVIEACEKLLKK